MKKNYQLLLDKVLAQPDNLGKRLLLHSCCAPCSSYVLAYLSQYLEITVLYYNPNITAASEYEMRIKEQKRLISCYNAERKGKYPIAVLEGEYDPALFYETVKGHETDPEGGERCELCFRLRLEEAAKYAVEGQYDFFTTTLSISPMKNAELLNTIGEEISARCGVAYLYSDFKKRGGYQQSIELSKEYDLYRQDYCGCDFSRREKT